MPVGADVLGWSITGMREAIERLTRSRAWDRTRAFEAINDAVWRVTMLDAALVRYRPNVYDDTLDQLNADDRAAVEETLAGLRLVRNRAGEADDLARFVETRTTDRAPYIGQITDSQWKTVPPRPSSSPTGTQVWEQARYRAYDDRLAGTAIGDTFERCAAFLLTAATRAMATAHPSNAHATH